MNEPFISPWLIYGISTLCEMREVLMFVSAISVFALVAYTVIFAAETECEYQSDWKKFNAWVAKLPKLAIPLCIVFVASNLIPTKETATAMLIASKATPENYDALKKEIVTLIGEVKKETE